MIATKISLDRVLDPNVSWDQTSKQFVVLNKERNAGIEYCMSYFTLVLVDERHE
jgi:hypothetical protein